MISFHGLSDQGEHFAVRFDRSDAKATLVRLHSECVTGDVLASARCDCGPQLQEALQRLHLEGGLLLYLRQEGRGIGLYRKLEAYLLQERGLDTFAANRALGHKDDERSYQVAAEMLQALDIKKIRLLSNNPDKQTQLINSGIVVESRIPTGVFVDAENRNYLEAKVKYSLHSIDFPPIQKEIP
ncbi:GTP cyclohydrolase II RibA [Comamonas sp. BIGb0152]|uniref:GTP cyclohydrolase II RibA n=1 Tax=Comamonas sp. BIGb0152 TaxID=2940601 RepID=UPI0021674083|nr:GTP cyclohydrolase II RibA [Comamonas sp. BIGb0152]